MVRPTQTSQSQPGDHAADMELAREVARNEPSAVDRFLVRMRCVPLILAAKNRRLGSPFTQDEINDLAQDTLTLLWKKLDTFGGRAQLETWAYRFCVLELMNSLRKKRRRRAADERSAREESRGGEPSTIDVHPGLDYDHVYLALDRLGDPEAEIVRMKHFRQLTFEEIGAELAISPNTAKTCYYRGLVKLRELLRAHGEEDER